MCIQVLCQHNLGWGSEMLTMLTLGRRGTVKGRLPPKVVFRQRSSSNKGRLPSKVVFRQRSSSVKGCLPLKVVFRQRSSFHHPMAPNVLKTALMPMATLETSLEANCDRQAGRQTEKATYRGSSYRSAQKWASSGGIVVFWDITDPD